MERHKTDALKESLPELVLIGGGNGTSALLEGLNSQYFKLTAVVNTVDDGGSTGRLREQYPGLIGIGDIRQCMQALATDHQLAKQFGQRDKDGHSIGNLTLLNTALDLGGVNQIESAIMLWGKKLKMRGSVIPISTDNADLKLEFPFAEKESYIGEYKIAHYKDCIRSKLGKLSLTPFAGINPRAETAIKQAEVILLAPGNFYGSIIPPLLTSGLPEALVESNAPFAMVSNLINDWKTRNFSISDYIEELQRQTGLQPDLAIANNGKFNEAADIKEEEMVKLDCSSSIDFICADLIDRRPPMSDPKDKIAATRSRIRHNGQAIGSLLHSYLKKL